MNPPSSYYQHIKSQTCLACGTHGIQGNPIEAAHVRGVLSPKTGRIMHRSHKGLPGWACIPLCRNCHQTQHKIGERDFIEQAGLEYVFGLHLFTNLLTFHLEVANHDRVPDA